MEQSIKLSGTNYNIEATTGKVLSTDKNLETKVSGGGGGGFSRRGSGYTAPVRVTSTTVVHDQLFIEDKSGKEHSYQLSGFDLACREGNAVSVIAAFKEGKSKGPYVAVVNHSTDKIYYHKTALNEICGPNKLIIGGLVLVATILGFSMFDGGGFMVMAIAAIASAIYYFPNLNNDKKALKAAVVSVSQNYQS